VFHDTSLNLVSPGAVTDGVTLFHRCGQGVKWVHMHPLGVERNRRNFVGEKIVGVPHSTPRAPPGRVRVNFRTFFAGRETFGGGNGSLISSF